MEKIQLENEINNTLKAIGVRDSDKKNKFIVEGIKTHYFTLNEIGILDKMTEEERLYEILTFSYGYTCGYINGKRDRI